MHSHQVRALLASRKAILKKCVDLENELRGLLKVFGIRLPSRVGHGSFDAELRETVSSDEMLACALVPLLDARTVLYKTYLKLDNAVKGLVRVDPICRRLMSIPGVGPVTALTFKAAVDDPNRFKSSRTVAAHFGLTARRFQSSIALSEAALRTSAMQWRHAMQHRRGAYALCRVAAVVAYELPMTMREIDAERPSVAEGQSIRSTAAYSASRSTAP